MFRPKTLRCWCWMQLELTSRKSVFSVSFPFLISVFPMLLFWKHPSIKEKHIWNLVQTWRSMKGGRMIVTSLFRAIPWASPIVKLPFYNCNNTFCQTSWHVHSNHTVGLFGRYYCYYCSHSLCHDDPVHVLENLNVCLMAGTLYTKENEILA